MKKLVYSHGILLCYYGNWNSFISYFCLGVGVFLWLFFYLANINIHALCGAFLAKDCSHAEKYSKCYDDADWEDDEPVLD